MRRNTLPFLDGVDMNGTDVVTVTPPRQSSNDPSPLKVTERVVDGKRYILRYNKEQARKDKRDREAILASLGEKVNHSDKNPVGNKGFRKYLKKTGPAHFTIDEEKIASEAMYDDLWVLTSNLPSGAPEIVRMYKELWMVEQVFRSMKSVLETRPIYHKRDDTIRGHVFCSFPALKLLKELEIRLAARGLRYEWEEIKQDLKALQEVELEFESTTWH